MLAHVKEYWPDEFAEKGEEKAMDTIRSGIKRCHEVGLESEYNVARYIDLLFAVGDGFEQEPWAKKIVEREAFPWRMKMDELWDEAVRRMEEQE